MSLLRKPSRFEFHRLGRFYLTVNIFVSENLEGFDRLSFIRKHCYSDDTLMGE